LLWSLIASQLNSKKLQDASNLQREKLMEQREEKKACFHNEVRQGKGGELKGRWSPGWCRLSVMGSLGWDCVSLHWLAGWKLTINN
jgi:hypothetical protein